MEPRPDYSGMTVNERLFSAGLLEDWDAAKKSDKIADTILSNPQRYGL